MRILVIVGLILVAFGTSDIAAQSSIVVEDQGVTIDFPNRLTFEAHIASTTAIEQVVLEYGIEKRTCGTVTARAFPDFAPGTSAAVAWTWEMRQSGSEPPGAQIWYRWHVTDTAGNEQVSDEQQVIWIDNQHAWRTISRGMLNLHWYHGSGGFAEELLTSAVTALEQLGQTTGVEPQAPIDMYIYASTADLRQAILYAPGWTGGQAFPDYGIVIIGISPEQIEWGKGTIAHELTHVLVGDLTFACLGSVPTWLNEGIAVYGEGGLDSMSAATLDDALTSNQLISVRALSGAFSEHPEKAGLSYAQSYSLVNFLITSYGSDKLLTLFGTLRDGMPIEAGLNETYGFGLDGLEDQWRAAMGAPPRQAEGTLATTTAVPTLVPTYPPIAAAPLAPAVSATPFPTATPQREAAGRVQTDNGTAIAEAPTETLEPLWPRVIALMLVAFITLLIMVVGAVIILFYASSRQKKSDTRE